VLLIDEAQQTQAIVLNELRLLTMEKFDSICLLTVVLAGDTRLTTAFKQIELIPLGTRIRTRLILEPWMKPQLVELLQESTRRAGNENLLTRGLTETIAEHSIGNPRVMMNLAAECLALGVRKEVATLDESIFFDLFPAPSPQHATRKKPSITATNK
jgi:type II secretory pathway predicted ATPase ExeA